MQDNRLSCLEQDLTNLYGLQEILSCAFSHYPHLAWPLPLRLTRISQKDEFFLEIFREKIVSAY